MVRQIITPRDMEKYYAELFTGQEETTKAAPILKRILDACSSSYESFFEDLEIEGLTYGIRLNIANHPPITYEKGKMDREVRLDIAPRQTKTALQIYLDRMKIEESFKDLYSLLGLERIMSKDRQYKEIRKMKFLPRQAIPRDAPFGRICPKLGR